MNTHNMRHALSIIAAVALSAASIQAESFDFKDPKGVNNVSFSLDAPLESISGTANGISGTVDFDPAHPENTTGVIVLETSSLMVSNSMMRDHLQGDHWMDVATYPTITFKTEKLTNISDENGKVSATAVGTLTVKDTTKEIEVPVSLTYLPGKLGARIQGMEGDILVVRSSFSILRSDYGINAGNHEDKVSDAIELKLSIAGIHVKE